MKRCPACKRLETDDALAFCRADGTPLVSDSGSVSAETGTVRFGSAPVASEIETSILPQTVTGANVSRSTGPTTVLPAQQTPGTTQALSKPKPRRAIVAIIFVTTLALAATIYFFALRKSNVPINSIAVMPFVNESGNADVEYLSDGMTETLISSLSQLPNLNVKARSSVFRYKGKETNAKTVGKELNVQAILNGRVVQRGDRLTLSLEFVDAQTENVIWSEQYNRKQTDLVTLQSEIARDVSSKLKTKLSGADEQKLTKNKTVSPEAYQAYLKGRYYYYQFTEESEKKAIEHFNQAISLDPNYAQAFAGLALVYTLTSSVYLPPSEAMPKAKQAVLKALALDGSLAEAHRALAQIHWWSDWDFPAAEQEFKRAIELNPNEPIAYSDYAMFLVLTLRRFDEGTAMADRALQLDSLSLNTHRDVARTFYYAHQYDRVAEEANKMLELDHNSVAGHGWLGNAYLMKGQYEQAIAELQKVVDPQSGNALDRLGYAYAVAGRKSEAMKTLAELQALSERKYISPYAIARIYAGLRDKERAFQWLEKGYEGRDDSLANLKTDPMFDSLHSDPRFTDLVRRVGLPQ